MAVIGLDLGGTKLVGAVLDENGAVLAEHSVLLDGRGGADAGALVVDTINRLLATGSDIDAIGIAVPGIAHAATGKVWAPNIRGWDDYPLRDEVRAAFGYESVPVAIESDRACCMLGESWRGAARGCRNAIFLTIGTGIGAGILADGRILRGGHDISGAIGWMALAHPWEEKYRPCGHFEYYASGDGLARHAQELLAERAVYTGVLRRASHAVCAEDVFAAYDAGDPVAADVLGHAVALWGMATANLVSLFNPERIVFGGGVFGPGVRFLDDILREARQWAQPIAINQVSLAASALGGAAALHGAARVALHAAGRA